MDGLNSFMEHDTSLRLRTELWQVAILKLQNLNLQKRFAKLKNFFGWTKQENNITTMREIVREKKETHPAGFLYMF